MSGTDVDQTAARADLARLLSACYYEPGPEFAEEGMFDTMADAAARVDPTLAALAHRLGEAFSTAGVDALLVDYARLFLGPAQARARPYGSVWLEVDQGLMQDSTLAIAGLYEQGGFEIAEEFRELPDHVAAELEFLYLLLFKAAQAMANGDKDALAQVSGVRKSFLGEHLGAWIDPFTHAVRAGADTPFYRSLAELTNAFVRMEVAAPGP